MAITEQLAGVCLRGGLDDFNRASVSEAAERILAPRPQVILAVKSAP
jgi:hypothetical protein